MFASRTWPGASASSWCTTKATCLHGKTSPLDPPFFPGMGELIQRVPFYPVLGNHEQDARFYDYVSLPEPEFHYEFTWGGTA